MKKTPTIDELKAEIKLLRKKIKVLDREGDIYAQALGECYEIDATYPIAVAAMDKAKRMKDRSGLFKN